MPLQIAYEGDFWALCTVTFQQKVDFLISNAHYYSQLYGIRDNLVTIFKALPET